jgi:hypothetical protein
MGTAPKITVSALTLLGRRYLLGSCRKKPEFDGAAFQWHGRQFSQPFVNGKKSGRSLRHARAPLAK